ncbi:MAG: hypothetical protein HQ553_07355 [Chloroflexi bacterium]|nr:hypothetical protein [Chloroflexota bacterium]
MNRKNTALVALFFVLVLVCVCIGCDDDSDSTADVTQQEISATNLTAEEFIDKVANASEGMETGDIEMDMIMDMSGKADGENLDTSMSLQANIAMDIPNKKIKMDISMEMPEELGTPFVPSTVEMETYIIDDTMYTNMGEMLGEASGWIKMEIPEDEYSGFEDIWESLSLTSQQEELLWEAAEINILGERKVNGVNCYEVSIVPNTEQFFDIMTTQNMSVYLSEDFDASDMDKALELIDDYSITYWYDKSTFQPVKMDIEMTMSDEEEDMDISINEEIYMKYTNLNKSVTIKLPSDAKDAVDMSGMMDFDF